MKYPKFLKENGTIGVCAPSFGCKGQPYESRQESAIKKFNELNHKVVFSNSVYGFKRKMASNTPSYYLSSRWRNNVSNITIYRF